MGQDLGRFPFGRPNTPRPPRTPTGAHRALIVGVYPSAFHVAWAPPADLDPRPVAERRRPYIGSLAVDVEPVVFWDGREPGPETLLKAWKRAVGFDPERMGTVSVGTNGPSGAGLLRGVLGPLGLDPAEVAFTDVVPWFFVKTGKGGQAEAIRDRLGPLADRLGVDPGSLPKRPTAGALVELAASEPRRSSLREELQDLGAGLIITLGQEALDAVRAVADAAGGVQRRLQPEGYGAVGNIVVGRRSASLVPLVHPGFARQTNRAEWTRALQSWRDDPLVAG